MKRICGSDELIEANLTDVDWSIHFDNERGRYQVKLGRVESPGKAVGTIELAVAEVVQYLQNRLEAHRLAADAARTGIKMARTYVAENGKGGERNGS